MIERASKTVKERRDFAQEEYQGPGLRAAYWDLGKPQEEAD